jgi:dephospho-CoA kinase
MIVIGLTGSIGMGKSTVAKMFAEEGAPYFSADDAVHALYAKGGAAVGPVAEAFPSSLRDGAIDRAALSAEIMHKPDAIQRLESIVHPLVGRANAEFLEKNRRDGKRAVVLDIPLLFESRRPRSFDKIVVVSAPAPVQRARVLERPGMTEEKLDFILSRQVPDAEKRAQADFVIDTGLALEATRAQVRAVLDALGEQS